ncbi:MAG: glycosyltransferase, partial [Acetobacteraceae bacterium]|nr:glycosyltransferase [Acetobacteraceae bacterium]
MRGSPKSESEDRAAEWSRLAQDAWRLGRNEAAAGRLDDAARWLDRASRIAASDHTIKLTLATVCLARKDDRALALFEEIAALYDVREVWLGLAAARRMAGDRAGAAAALANALARATLSPDCETVANTIARETDAAGWCGVSGDGSLHIARSDSTPGPPRVLLDGEAMRPRRAGMPGAVTLPRHWRKARELRVEIGDRPLIGSPINLSAIRRVEGFVQAEAGGLKGWAWHPGDAGRDPSLMVLFPNGARYRFTAGDSALNGGSDGVLRRPRAFEIQAGRLAALSGPLRVVGEDGRDLFGSPLDPGAPQRVAAEAAQLLAELFPVSASRPPARARQERPAMPPALPVAIARPPTAIGADRRDRGIDVVIPVYAGTEDILACLDSVFAHGCASARITVVDDCTPDTQLARALDEFAAKRRIRLIRQTANRGFPASANAGLRASQGRDVVLLNSDTLVPPLWLERLRHAAYSARDIGTVSPLSNDATILSYPEPQGGNAAPDLAGTIRMASLAHRANGSAVVDIPTAVGFCMYIRGDCLKTVGLLREDVFAQGYGEENDFCMRARHLGWRHVAATGVFVTHAGGRSFGSAKSHLMERNAVILEELHPGYGRLIEAFIEADPLAETRRKLDRERWRETRRPSAPAVILITHDSGGGVERAISAQCAALRGEGLRPVVLRPASLKAAKAVSVSGGEDECFPNLRFALPDELPALLRFLKSERPVGIAVHHLLGHDPSVVQVCGQLGVPYDIHLHDYAWFCPRISLCGAERRYCGEPEPTECESCVADAGSVTEETISVAALRQRSAALLQGARRVIAPSFDCAARIARHFPSVRPEVVAPESEQPFPEQSPAVRGRS